MARLPTEKVIRMSFWTRVRLPSAPPTKNALLSTKTKVRFLNDVCLRQMMLAAPMMTASPNDAWLRHILGQTSHHCGTEWSNIILSEAKNIISPQGDASFEDIQGSSLDFIKYAVLRLLLFVPIFAIIHI